MLNLRSLLRGRVYGFGAECSGNDLTVMYCYRDAEIWGFGKIHYPCYRREGQKMNLPQCCASEVILSAALEV